MPDGYDEEPPEDGYEEPEDGYGVPEDGYRVPEDGYGVPEDGYGVPEDGYLVPRLPESSSSEEGREAPGGVARVPAAGPVPPSPSGGTTFGAAGIRSSCPLAFSCSRT